jgi:hypothetical protein
LAGRCVLERDLRGEASLGLGQPYFDPNAFSPVANAVVDAVISFLNSVQ